MTEIPIIGRKPEAPALVEVCRSFAYKLNLANHGGPQYESADFFASRKVQCPADEAEQASKMAFDECVAEVRASVKAFVEEMQRRRAPKKGNAAEFEKWKEERTA